MSSTPRDLLGDARRRRWQFLLAWLGGSVVTAVLCVSLRAGADGDPNTDDLPRLVPFSGTLEKDGAVWSGHADLTFTLYAGATATAALWSETQEVTVNRGAFTVLLGAASAASATALEDQLTSDVDLYVGVSVSTASGTVTLADRKRIVAMPYAVLTTAATWVDAGRRLVVEDLAGMPANGSSGPFTLTDLDAHRLTLDGDDINSTSSLGLNRFSAEAVTLSGDLSIAGALLVNGAHAADHVSGDALTLRADGGRLVFDGPVTFNRDTTGLQVTSIFPNSGGSCVEYNLQDLDGAGSVERYCPGGMVMVGGLFQAYPGNNAKAIEVMRCCPANGTVQ
ncbi:MAG: hypothetical protein U1F43_17050 [Myxococcota bacterium]